MNKRCPHGRRCTFAHGEDELNSVVHSKVCKDSIKGPADHADSKADSKKSAVDPEVVSGESSTADSDKCAVASQEVGSEETNPCTETATAPGENSEPCSEYLPYIGENGKYNILSMPAGVLAKFLNSRFSSARLAALRAGYNSAEAMAAAEDAVDEIRQLSQDTTSPRITRQTVTSVRGGTASGMSPHGLSILERRFIKEMRDKPRLETQPYHENHTPHMNGGPHMASLRDDLEAMQSFTAEAWRASMMNYTTSTILMMQQQNFMMAHGWVPPPPVAFFPLMPGDPMSPATGDFVDAQPAEQEESSKYALAEQS